MLSAAQAAQKINNPPPVQHDELSAAQAAQKSPHKTKAAHSQLSAAQAAQKILLKPILILK